jgi:WD40 repeat protein
MELNIALGLLLQGLPAIAELLSAIQTERVLYLKQHATSQKKLAKTAQEPEAKRARDDLEAQLQLAAYQRETSLQLLEHQNILEHWSLGLLPTQLWEHSTHSNSVPLQIFLAPPTIQLAPTDQGIQGLHTLEGALAQGLANFLNQHYPLNSPERPTEFLSGAWRDHELQRESRIKALFHQLRDRPTLVLETDIMGEFLNIRLAYWGLTQSQYCYRTVIADLPWRTSVYAVMKRRALQWKETAQRLLAIGESPATILPLGGNNVHNLEWLEKEIQWQSHGIETNTLCFSYITSPEDFTELHQQLTRIYSVLAGWIADAHHLLNTGVSPILPGLMTELINPIASPPLGQELFRTIISGYRELFRTLENERPDQAAQFALQLAHSLNQLPDRTWAREQVTYSLNLWLNQRQLPQVQHESGWKMLKPVLKPDALKPDDVPYLQSLKACFAVLGEDERAHEVENWLDALKSSNGQSGTSCSNAAPSNVARPLPPLANNGFRGLMLGHSADACSSGNQKSGGRQGAIQAIILTHTFSGYSGKAASLAFCGDGQTLASASDDHTITLRCLKSGTTQQTIASKAGRVLTLKLSQDGEILASSHQLSDRSSIKVWNLRTGNLLHTLTGHHKRIYALAISPEKQFLVSGGHKIKLWDLQTGKWLHTLTGHNGWVYSLTISPDGQTLISAGADKTIKLWHLPTGRLLHTLTGHLDWIRSIALSADGQLLVSGSDDNTVRLWNLGNGTLLNILTGHRDGVSSVVISPDQQIVLSGSKDKTIRLWQVKDGTLLNTLTNHRKQVYSLAMSSDGKTFASGSEDRTILVWQRLEPA